MFAFTPIAFMIMRGVVAGVAPSLEEAAQTLRADRRTTFAPSRCRCSSPAWRTRSWSASSRASPTSATRSSSAGSISVLSTDIFFAIVGAQYDQGRAASLALILSAFALAVFALQRRLLGSTSFTTVTGKGDSGLPMPLPDGVRRAYLGIALPWLAFTLVVYVFAFVGGFVQTWGRDYTPTLRHFVTAFDLQRGSRRRRRPGVGRHGVELVLHDAQARGDRRAVCAGARPAGGLAAGAQRSSAARAPSSSARCWRSRFPARCSA